MNAETIPLKIDVAEQRRIKAEAWRRSLTERGILCVNMISSPGAGKTSLLQAMAQHWNGALRCAVLVGDIATDRDAQRLAPYVPVRQLTTGGACHLELPLVQSGFAALDTADLELLFIENVGNLVCPASHDLGEHMRIVILSVTEGDDKPGKYPKAFRSSDACVINKVDLLPYVPFSLEAVTTDARLIRAEMPVIATSATTKIGISSLCDFLQLKRKNLLNLT